MTRASQAALNAVIRATRAYQSTLSGTSAARATLQPPESTANPPAPAPDAESLARLLAPAISRQLGRDIRERGRIP